MRALVFPLVFILLGCVSTVLPPSPAVRGIERLRELNAPQVKIDLEAPQDTVLAGYQFLGIVVPFGSVVIQDLRRHLLNRIVETLAKHKVYGDFSNLPPHDRTKARILVESLDTSISAYDLLIVRRVVCTVSATITMTFPMMLPSTQNISVSEGAWRKFGFRPQLQEVFHSCLTAFAERIAQDVSRRLTHRSQSRGIPHFAYLRTPSPS